MADQFSIEVSSAELGKRQVISGKNLTRVQAQAQALADAWEAEEQTQKAKAELENVRNILSSVLGSKPAIDWVKLVTEYPQPKPAFPDMVDCPPKPQANEPEPVYLRCPAKPKTEPKPTAISYLSYPPDPRKERFSGSHFEHADTVWSEEVKKIESENQRRYDENVAAIEQWCSSPQRIEEEQDIAKWSEACKQIDDENLRRKEEHPDILNRWRIEYKTAVANWTEAYKQAEIENIRRHNDHTAVLEKWNLGRIAYEQNEVARLKADYESLQSKAVVDYCKLALSSSVLSDCIEREFDLEYIPQTKTLIVDHSLPAPDDLPSVKEVKYVKARNEAVEVYLSEKEFNQVYDNILYQICLRTLYEIFVTDDANALSAVVFNGWVESIDKATGKDTKGCLISIHAKKEEFQKINLTRVDPKVCFKALKGVGSSTLHSLTPIAPVLKISREDKRFVPSYNVAGQLDERSNLAAMDWEDFEHLIRELFEKEFSRSGDEVKVTQASRDGGVDAVAFDPDPIHGGKSVIQAKRYTNTVGVAAVRELYGTVLNEGAMKGILVTTADYGPDAYEFAKGKPLVLLNGANLLHLLEKHGHKAKIDIKEAKRIFGERIQ